MPIVAAPCSRATCKRVRQIVVEAGAPDPAPGYCSRCAASAPRVRARALRQMRLVVEFARMPGSLAWRATSPDDPRIDARGMTLADAAAELSRQLATPRDSDPAPAHEVGGDSET